MLALNVNRFAQMSSSPTLSILLVDDETELLREIALYLKRRGHHVMHATSFPTGAALIDNAVDPDVLITDVRMPGGCGLDLARRARTRHPRCRVVVMTGHLDESQISTADDIGASAVLFKPFGFRRLLSHIDAAGMALDRAARAAPAPAASELM
jgi:DNA-binding NtrC family response regulator